MSHPATALSVNLNKIALIRNSRPGNYPDVCAHAKVCLDAGAAGITVHPRPDQRHIRPQDVYALRELVRNYPQTEFNIEGNPFADSLQDFPGFLALVEATRPHQCTLVPDSNSQLTSDHGFDLQEAASALQPVIAQLHAWGVRVSLFMDPDLEQISRAKALGADRIELYTGPFAQAVREQDPELPAIFARYQAAALHAQQLGLGVNAGHDLDLENLPLFRQIPNLLEVSIGHALIVDAIAMGLAPTVDAYLTACAH